MTGGRLQGEEWIASTRRGTLIVREAVEQVEAGERTEAGGFEVSAAVQVNRMGPTRKERRTLGTATARMLQSMVRARTTAGCRCQHAHTAAAQAMPEDEGREAGPSIVPWQVAARRRSVTSTRPASAVSGAQPTRRQPPQMPTASQPRRPQRRMPRLQG